MIVFYAHTGTLLLNMLNLKANQLQNIVADIYIFNSGRMPRNLITFTEQSHLFRKVIVVEPCWKYFSSKIRVLNKVNPLVLSLLTVLCNNKYYSKIIKKHITNDKYISIITHGLWLESIYFVKYFYKLNKDITIQIMDEGSGTNNVPLESLSNPKRDELFSTRFHKVMYDFLWFITTGHSCNQDIANFRNQFTDYYLYTPKYSRLYQETSLIPHKLLPFDSNNKLTPLLNKLLDGIDYEEYIHRKLWILSDYDVLESHPSHVIFMKILETTLSSFSQNNVILKGHPNLLLNEEYYSSLWPELYMDNRKYQLEALYSQINLNDKILITRVSSAVFYPKYMFNAEPYVIFTYKLSPKDVDTEAMNRLVNSLKELYENPQKIYVPFTEEELQNIISYLS